MEIKIDREKLKGKSLVLATPMYGGNCKGEFANSVIDLSLLCKELGVPFTSIFTYNASLITRGRDYLARLFLETDYTHMLFVDADIVFSPLDVIACLAAEKELIGGPYPMKDIDWPWVRDLILAKPDVTEEELTKLARFYHFNYAPGTRPGYDHSQFLEVENVSTGFMMIERSVFAAIREKYPDRVYLTDFARDISRGQRHETYHYFGSGLENGTLVSEDYHFCARWKETGGKIWLAPWMRMQHIGDYVYGGGGLEMSEQAGAIIDTWRSWKAPDKNG